MDYDGGINPGLGPVVQVMVVVVEESTGQSIPSIVMVIFEESVGKLVPV